MIGQRFYTNELKPDFGIPWAERFQKTELYEQEAWSDAEILKDLEQK